MKSYTVYKHTTPSGKVYIGITQQKPTDRWKNGRGYNKGQLFSKAIAKYGWDNIKHEIIFQNLSKEEACEKEIEMIAKYHSNISENGYNVLEGGICSPPSAEARKKSSEVMKAKWQDADFRENTRTHMKGKKRSEKARENIAVAQKKRFENPLEREKISQRQIGKTRTEEAKKKTSETLKKHYEDAENIKHLIESHPGKKIKCLETGEIFSSVRRASIKYSISHYSISLVCKGKRKTAGGYQWSYV